MNDQVVVSSAASPAMKRAYCLIGAHAVVWVILVSFALSEMSMTLFGKQARCAVLLSVLLFPIVLLLSWPTVRELHESRVRRYLVAFQMMGALFWILNLYLFWVFTIRGI
jgi:hypothetical protein